MAAGIARGSCLFAEGRCLAISTENSWRILDLVSGTELGSLRRDEATDDWSWKWTERGLVCSSYRGIQVRNPFTLEVIETLLDAHAEAYALDQKNLAYSLGDGRINVVPSHL
ncbi:MAG TPA: hypothetical protein VEZ90_03885 [Blastocatellia bacterium]|nr:hypothetical protein [Blastocatellia bacterium]